MKKQAGGPSQFGVKPAMEVYDSAWKLLGTVPDRGTEASLKDAKLRYEGAAHVLPTIIEVSR